MPRAHFTRAVVRRVSGAPADGQAAVYKAGTNTLVTDTLFTTDAGSTTLANPFPFTNGVVDFFMDKPQRVRLAITPSGAGTQQFDDVDVPVPAAEKTIVVPVPLVSTPGPVTVQGNPTVVHIPAPASPGFARARRLRARLATGTNAVCQLNHNGAQMQGTSAITVTPTGVNIDLLPLGIYFADGDQVALQVVSVTGSPVTLSGTLWVETSV